MKIVFPYLNTVFDTEAGMLPSLVIENPGAFCKIISDFVSQSEGKEGKIIVSASNKPCDIRKDVEIIQQVIPFNPNTKAVLNGLNSIMEKEALSPEYYERSMVLLSEIEELFGEICMDLPTDISFSKLSIGSFIKASGIEINNDYLSIPEQLIDYMDLVRAVDHDKLFVILNLHSYLNDKELGWFAETVCLHGFHVLLLSSYARKCVERECRVVIDEDLCEI